MKNYGHCQEHSIEVNTEVNIAMLYLIPDLTLMIMLKKNRMIQLILSFNLFFNFLIVSIHCWPILPVIVPLFIMRILAEYQLWLSCSSSSGLSLLRPLASKQNLYRWHRLIAGHALLLQEGFWRLPASGADLQQMQRSWMRRCRRSVPQHRAISWRTPGAECRYMWINLLAKTEGERWRAVPSSSCRSRARQESRLLFSAGMADWKWQGENESLRSMTPPDIAK